MNFREYLNESFFNKSTLPSEFQEILMELLRKEGIDLRTVELNKNDIFYKSKKIKYNQDVDGAEDVVDRIKKEM